MFQHQVSVFTPVSYTHLDVYKRQVYTSHTEGLSSQWKQELLKACIVRTLKQASDGLRYDALFDDIKKQISGFSIGEFKDALYDVVNDKFISVVNDVYNY